MGSEASEWIGAAFGRSTVGATRNKLSRMRNFFHPVKNQRKSQAKNSGFSILLKKKVHRHFITTFEVPILRLMFTLEAAMFSTPNIP